MYKIRKKIKIATANRTNRLTLATKEMLTKQQQRLINVKNWTDLKNVHHVTWQKP